MDVSIICDQQRFVFGFELSNNSTNPYELAQSILDQCQEYYDKTWKYAWQCQISIIHDDQMNQLSILSDFKDWLHTSKEIHVYIHSISPEQNDVECILDFDLDRFGICFKKVSMQPMWISLLDKKHANKNSVQPLTLSLLAATTTTNTTTNTLPLHSSTSSSGSIDSQMIQGGQITATAMIGLGPDPLSNPPTTCMAYLHNFVKHFQCLIHYFNLLTHC